AAFDELRAVLLAEDRLRKPAALRLDHRRVEMRVRPARPIPALEERVDAALSALEEVKNVVLPFWGGDEERPALLVDQALRQVSFPDRPLEARGLVHDQPVEALAQQRDGVVRGLSADLGDPTGEITQH